MCYSSITLYIYIYIYIYSNWKVTLILQGVTFQTAYIYIYIYM